MTLSPDDLAAMGERHTRKQVKDPPTDRCDECRRPWPCDSRRLLDEVEALRDWEQRRLDAGWPTPNHMRHVADALDVITPAKYGDVLRWVADACDAE